MSSLVQEEFDFSESQRRRDDGRDLAAKRRREVLELAREIARAIALGRPDRSCTADEVQRQLRERGYPASALGNAAGSLFRGREWELAGYAPSARVTRHAGLNRVWVYRECTS